MAKKAVLIGINYPGTSVELRGCVNDVRRMQKCLIERFGFSKDDITVLIDTDNSCIQPTGKNIRDELKKLIESGKSGDFLVFHYSGHGTRIPPETGIGDSTGFDECITPCDMNLIMDHEFKEMVAHVKKGCRLTIISDSCHSGGLIEEVKEQIGESHVNPPKLGIANFFLSIVMTFLATCGINKSLGDDQETITREVELENSGTIEMKTRYLPLDSFICLLEQQTGETDIEFRKIRSILVKVFGEDSSPHVLSKSMKRNGHRGFLSMFQGKGEVNADGSRLIPDKAILLSGCQTDQKSEDVYIRRTGKAYGAFSDAIQTILSTTRKEKKITNKDMVMEARKLLKKQKFTQRPGLYCHDRYVNKQFIC
ncbi:Metacaspase-8 [Cardamine amara subsp. amara]|uniref:Metacaspase-8 n=1 Tax=Cardamine amara subsp. amara TaxID=228776 RepID=A0ABD1BW02_CARAN